jgi:hypothetical protein
MAEDDLAHKQEQFEPDLVQVEGRLEVGLAPRLVSYRLIA